MALLLMLSAIYFLPTLIATARHHQSWPAIAVVNILLGWSVIGYLIALVWSLSASGWEARMALQRMRAETAPAPRDLSGHFYDVANALTENSLSIVVIALLALIVLLLLLLP